MGRLGLGLTVFERYPTDRVRGEFPNKNYKFLPLEQYFPFPDAWFIWMSCFRH